MQYAGQDLQGPVELRGDDEQFEGLPHHRGHVDVEGQVVGEESLQALKERVGFFRRMQIVSYSDSASDPSFPSLPSPSPSLSLSSFGASVRAIEGVRRDPLPLGLDPVFSGLGDSGPPGTLEAVFSLDASPAGTAFISEVAAAGGGVPEVSPAVGVVAVGSVDDMAEVYT